MPSTAQVPELSAIKRNIRTAMIYPLATLALTIIACGVVVLHVLPQMG